jgi:hypothetical protein
VNVPITVILVFNLDNKTGLKKIFDYLKKPKNDQ